MKKRFTDRTLLARIVCGVIANSFSVCLIAAPMTFTLDPTQSTITISGSFQNSGLSIPLMQQSTGSLTTTFGGTLKADVSGSTIQFTGGSVIDAQTNGNWQPLPGGTAGSAPADFGAQGGITGLVTVKGALRNIVLDATSVALLVTSGSFNSGGIVFGFPTNSTASLDYLVTGSLSASGGKALQGLSTNKVTTTATLTNNGNALTLSISVIADFAFTVITANDAKVTLTGKLVATAATAPPLLVSPATVAVVSGTVSFQWQAAPGQTFRVESSTDLQTWATRQTGLTSATSTYTFSGAATGTKEYFRLVQ
jgi:hypothetical protein